MINNIINFYDDFYGLSFFQASTVSKVSPLANILSQSLNASSLNASTSALNKPKKSKKAKKSKKSKKSRPSSPEKDLFFRLISKKKITDSSTILDMMDAGISLKTLKELFPQLNSNGFFDSDRNYVRPLGSMHSLEDVAVSNDKENQEKRSSAKQLFKNEAMVLKPREFLVQWDDFQMNVHDRYLHFNFTFSRLGVSYSCLVLKILLFL